MADWRRGAPAHRFKPDAAARRTDSRAITAQVNREHLDGQMHFTCIEPYPRGFLQRGVAGITELVTQMVQDVDLARFEALQAGDVLFIDTSHVVRTGGDVVWLYGRVLPRLRPGVHVHIHDVFLPASIVTEQAARRELVCHAASLGLLVVLLFTYEVVVPPIAVAGMF